jgi:hypothetical protein
VERGVFCGHGKDGGNVQAERQNKKGVGCRAVSLPLAFRPSGKMP